MVWSLLRGRSNLQSEKSCILGNKGCCTVGTLLKVGLEIAPNLEERAEDWTVELEGECSIGHESGRVTTGCCFNPSVYQKHC